MEGVALPIVMCGSRE